MAGIYLPYAKRNTNLGVVAPWAPDNVKIIIKQLVQPFFYNCFTIASGYANYRYMKFYSMKSR